MGLMVIVIFLSLAEWFHPFNESRSKGKPGEVWVFISIWPLLTIRSKKRGIASHS